MKGLATLKSILFFKKILFIYLRERERESTSRGRGRGSGRKKSQADPMLRVPNLRL